ncbi:MAG: glycyl-radical enzyme activating protein [Desulfobacteraceae bacterium]|nr:glycyl-radical enzyme activating protein [Desulfobacteraceae bacterium]
MSGPLMESGDMGGVKAPAIFSIQNFCLHDGPGVRSIVFLKGCPLRCVWCQNPESWRTDPELAFKAHLCIDCKTCVNTCPQQAMSAPGIRDTQKCDGCFACVENCPSEALVCFGKYYSIDQLVESLRPEFPYMKNTGGGVTFSGGEPTLFLEFVGQLSKRLHEEGIHTALETCGYFDSEKEIGFLSDIDLVLFDIKLYDEKAHRKFCGKSNKMIKQNLTRLSASSLGGTGPVIWPRLPLIPTVTDTTENLTGWAQFLKNIGISFLTLVPYHNMGDGKREWLNLPLASEFPALTEKHLQVSIDLLEKNGISCFAPGEEDWAQTDFKAVSDPRTVT